ncbi:Clp protease N-terminal domain-containing protein, partial [Escherichia coli]
TTRFQEALADAQSLALGNDNPYIEPVHLLLAMLRQPDGATKNLLARAGVNTGALDTALDRAIKHLPQVQGGEQVQVGRD